jgi:hypothetical protein
LNLEQSELRPKLRPEENMINGLKATEIIDDHYLMAIDDPNLGSSRTQ